MLDSVIRFIPVYMDRVWGSEDPDDFPLNKTPSGNPVGEIWDISDRPEEQSFVRVNNHIITFDKVLKDYGKKIMGPRWSAHEKFPLLVKRLICKSRLSLQVHPPKKIARDYGLPSKDEFWYVTNTSQNSQIFVGLKNGVTREQFIKSLNDNDLECCLNNVGSRRGDAIFIPSGRLHAIGRGNDILEIQENSDTTFRVYDWNRLGLDGKPRDLHVKQALQSINFEDYEPHVVNVDMSRMIVANCNNFRVHQFVKIPGEHSLRFEKGVQPRMLHVVDGQVTVNGKEIVRESESVMLSYSDDFALRADRYAKFLITDNFYKS